MPGTVRRLSGLFRIQSLFNKAVFAIAFSGIALSLFFFAPGRMISVRTAVLSASCILLLLTSGTFSRRRKRSIRMPLMILGIAGALFACWGLFVIAGWFFTRPEGTTELISGAQFLGFGLVTFFTTRFAGR